MKSFHRRGKRISKQTQTRQVNKVKINVMSLKVTVSNKLKPNWCSLFHTHVLIHIYNFFHVPTFIDYSQYYFVDTIHSAKHSVIEMNFVLDALSLHWYQKKIFERYKNLFLSSLVLREELAHNNRKKAILLLHVIKSFVFLRIRQECVLMKGVELCGWKTNVWTR